MPYHPARSLAHSRHSVNSVPCFLCALSGYLVCTADRKKVLFLTYLIIRRWSYPLSLKPLPPPDQCLSSILSLRKAISPPPRGSGAFCSWSLSPLSSTVQPASLDLVEVSVCVAVPCVQHLAWRDSQVTCPLPGVCVLRPSSCPNWQQGSP